MEKNPIQESYKIKSFLAARVPLYSQGYFVWSITPELKIIF
jgi:hypothetical protein